MTDQLKPDRQDGDGLLPCPFCGGNRISIKPNSIGDYFAICDGKGERPHCGAQTSDDSCETPERAAHRWNMRATPQPAPDAIREALEKPDLAYASTNQIAACRCGSFPTLYGDGARPDDGYRSLWCQTCMKHVTEMKPSEREVIDYWNDLREREHAAISAPVPPAAGDFLFEPRDRIFINLENDIRFIREALSSPDIIVLQNDLREMLQALDLFDGARPQSSHEVFQECIAEVRRLKTLSPSATGAAEPVARCPVCDWPLVTDPEEGCVPGNCAYRPDDPAEQERIRKRRAELATPPVREDREEGIVWRRVNGEPFEYAIQQGWHGDEFVKLLNGSCLRRLVQPGAGERERISFPRWWIEQIRDGLMKMDKLPSGELGDWAFLFREQLNDALSEDQIHRTTIPASTPVRSS